jgi:hypothetical protein
MRKSFFQPLFLHFHQVFATVHFAEASATLFEARDVEMNVPVLKHREGTSREYLCLLSRDNYG